MPLKYSNSMSVNNSMFAKSAIAFAISSIFASSEVGALYEPWDLSTLFKDSTGSIPAVVDQEVGLMLDKSRGLVLGPELVTNGTFDTDSGWTKGVGWSISGGVAAIDGSNTAASYLSAITAPALTAGKSYKVSFTYSVSAGRIRLNPAVGTTTALLTAGSSGQFKNILLSNGNGSLSVQAVDAGTIATIDNLSIKELAGSHAYQTVTASKPILRQDANGFYYLEHDGFDDQLTTGNVFNIQNDSFMALAYSYNAAASSSPFSVFGVFKDSTNYMSLYQRPASAHIFSAGIRAASFGLAPVTPAGTTGSTASNTPLVTHARLNTDIIYVGKNQDAEISAPFALGANTLTAAPLKINTGLAIDLRFYGGLYRQKDLTVEERANVIRYFAQHAGVTI